MNVIARLEYELAYHDSTVHRFNHYTTRTHTPLLILFSALITVVPPTVSRGCKRCWLHLCRRVRPIPNEYPRYDIKLHLIVRLKFRSFGEWGVSLYCYYSQVHNLMQIIYITLEYLINKITPVICLHSKMIWQFCFKRFSLA